MAAQSTNPARGMRDFLPADVRKREYVIGIIKEVYESYGFEPLETPAVENLETLTGKYGEEGNQLIFKILKRGEKLDSNDKELADLALRYDLTVPLARVVANYKNELPKFFKRYQIQPVWRADRPARGRFREFYQCDVDTIGSRSMLVEAEQISAVCEIFKKLNFTELEFKILLNHRQVLTGILDNSGIPTEKHVDAMVAMDKFDKIKDVGVKDELLKRGIPPEGAERFRAFISDLTEKSLALPSDTPAEANEFVMNELHKFLSGHSEGEAGLAEIEMILQLSKNNQSNNQILVAPALARGLSYYTGAIMEAFAVKGDFSGSLGGGGRYDGLIGMFGKEEIPACGFSLGLERILVVMEERGMFPEDLQKSSAADVMVTIWNEESIGESLKLANDLREKGLRVLVYPEADKLGKQFKYADSIKIPFVCVLGESELAAQQVTLKNMQTGEQETVLREEVAERISTWS